MAGGFYVPNIEDQRIEEYTENERIIYDYLGMKLEDVITILVIQLLLFMVIIQMVRNGNIV